jgi:hypothetical protein
VEERLDAGNFSMNQEMQQGTGSDNSFNASRLAKNQAQQRVNVHNDINPFSYNHQIRTASQDHSHHVGADDMSVEWYSLFEPSISTPAQHHGVHNDWISTGGAEHLLMSNPTSTAGVNDEVFDPKKMKKKISDAQIYGPRFCVLFDNYCKKLGITIDIRRHLMSLCFEHLVSFIKWARENDAQVQWIQSTLLENDCLRPEVRNGVVIVLIYTFASIKATLDPNWDMFSTLQDSEQGLGIANKFSLKIYNDPFFYLIFLKTSISALIDAGVLPDNERQNQPKRSKVPYQNREEIQSFQRIQKMVIDALDSGNIVGAKGLVADISNFWQQRGKFVRNRRFTAALHALAQPRPMYMEYGMQSTSGGLPLAINESTASNRNFPMDMHDDEEDDVGDYPRSNVSPLNTNNTAAISSNKNSSYNFVASEAGTRNLNNSSNVATKVGVLSSTVVNRSPPAGIAGSGSNSGSIPTSISIPLVRVPSTSSQGREMPPKAASATNFQVLNSSAQALNNPESVESSFIQEKALPSHLFTNANGKAQQASVPSEEDDDETIESGTVDASYPPAKRRYLETNLSSDTGGASNNATNCDGSGWRPAVPAIVAPPPPSLPTLNSAAQPYLSSNFSQHQPYFPLFSPRYLASSVVPMTESTRLLSPWSIPAMRLERVAWNRWEIKETRVFDIQGFIRAAMRQQDYYFHRMGQNFHQRNASSLDSSNGAPVLLGSISLIQETSIAEELKARELRLGKDFNASSCIGTGSVLEQELNCRRALLTSWPHEEISQLVTFLRAYQQYCCTEVDRQIQQRQTEQQQSNKKKRNLQQATDIDEADEERDLDDLNDDEIRPGNMIADKPITFPTLFDFWLTQSPASPKSCPPPNSSTGRIYGYLAYEVPVRIAVMVRANPKLSIDEDIWCAMYPSELQLGGTNEDVSFGTSLADLFPQLIPLSQKLRSGNSEFALQGREIAIRYFAHSSAYGSNAAVADSGHDNSEPGAETKLPLKLLLSNYQTIGTWAQSTTRVLSR